MLYRDHVSIADTLCQTRHCTLTYLSKRSSLRCDSGRTARLNATRDGGIVVSPLGEATGHRDIIKLRLDDLEKAMIVDVDTILDLMSSFASLRAGGNTNECTCA